MLTSKTPTTNEVTTLRLSTGEELIGRFVSQDETTITLSKVIAIQLVPMNNGSMGITLAPFMASVPDDGSQIFYKSSLVVAPQKTRSEISDRYTEATSSIVPATAAQAGSLLRP